MIPASIFTLGIILALQHITINERNEVSGAGFVLAVLVCFVLAILCAIGVID